jgi:hypothetical protein
MCVREGDGPWIQQLSSLLYKTKFDFVIKKESDICLEDNEVHFENLKCEKNGSVILFYEKERVSEQ